MSKSISQLIRLQERLLSRLQDVKEELEAPTSSSLLKEARQLSGENSEESLGQVATSVEEAIRALKVFESEIRSGLLDDPGTMEIEGIPNLPDSLARFLSERSQSPGFAFQVAQDPVRGWTVTWKEYTDRGTIRGSGQFYERPYAWLDE